MRKAEEIIYSRYGCTSWEEVCGDFLGDVSPSMIREIVVQAQIDAIEATCKRCAEEAEIEDYDEHMQFSPHIDEKSILKVADKMKEELE